MKRTTTKQKFRLVASVLSGIAFVGVIGAVAFNQDDPSELAGTLVPPRKAPEVRIEPVRHVPRPVPAVREKRFAAVPPDLGILNAPPSEGDAYWQAPEIEPPAPEVAADPGSWSVDIKNEDVAPGEPQSGPIKTARVETTLETPQPRRVRRRSRRRSADLSKRLKEISPKARPRLIKKFAGAKVAWPPDDIAMVAIKDQKVVELYARSDDDPWAFIHRYKVLAASGKSGPKLRRGDRQVPEGVYRISYLNPNSRYHVSLRVNYPNAFDRKMARKDGRKDLGGDIMIHGKNVSAGCLAMGDEAIEELFVLADEVGLRHIKLVIAPRDFRKQSVPADVKGPAWLNGLYTEVASAMSQFEAPAEPGLLSFLGLQTP